MAGEKREEGGVPSAHAPETGGVVGGEGPAVREVDVTLAEVVASLETKRDRLKQAIVEDTHRKALAQGRITAARQELVEVERFLKAAKPRGQK